MKVATQVVEVMLPEGVSPTEEELARLRDSLQAVVAQQLERSAPGLQARLEAEGWRADWNSDGVPDLIVGEQTSGGGKIRVYLNTGTQDNPEFGGFFYVQAGTGDLSVPSVGCLGVFPRMLDWNADGRKDLVLGLADGTVEVFMNNGSEAVPGFGTGVMVHWRSGRESEP